MSSDARAREAWSLLQSCGRGKESMAESLLEAGACPDGTLSDEEAMGFIVSEPEAATGRPLPWNILIGTAPAMVAAWAGHAGLVRMLARRGADLNKASPTGMTALHFAAEHGRVEAAVELVQNGASLDLLNEKGVSPLGMAAYYGRYPSESLAIVEMLLRRGASRACINDDSLRVATEWNQNEKIGSDWGWTMDSDIKILLDVAKERSELDDASLGENMKVRKKRPSL